jgi:Xaa-Pro aminopeptidase
MDRLPEGLVVAVTANGMLQRGADSAYHFTQDANFFYLTGIDEPDIILVMDSRREFLIVPARERERTVFDGQVDPQRLSAISGINDIVNEPNGWKRIDALILNTKNIATLAPAPSFIEQYGMYANPSRSRFIERLKRHTQDLEIVDIRPDLAAIRMIKQPLELKVMQQAIDITLATLKEVMNKPHGYYAYEFQIEADISRGFRFRGSLGHAFEPIVASGKQACTLHNVINEKRLGPNELVVIDVGANVSGYAADITRVMATGKPTKRQKDIFKAVKDTQAYAFSLLGPGVRLKTYENQVVKFIGSKLKELKVITNLKPETIRRYYPHATSHFLGLNVHDVGDYTKPLLPGSVLTVEPGIYIPEENTGVRIEDDILITKEGIKVLSSALPAKLD